MKIVLKFLAAAGAAAMLSGCQSIFDDRPLFGRSSLADAAAVDMSDYFVARLEAGRAHLLRNRPTQAVIAFRQASYYPARSAEAFNGMAVAYARLGRSDLAARHFAMAVAADPADPRFARNLARLQSARLAEPSRHALVSDRNPAAPPQSAAAFAESGAQLVQARVRFESSSARLVRYSSKEVRIVSSSRTGGWAASRRAPEFFVRSRLVEARTRGAVNAPREIALADLLASTLLADPVRVQSLGARR